MKTKSDRYGRQLHLFPEIKIVKEKVPYWVKMGLDQPLTQFNH